MWTFDEENKHELDLNRLKNAIDLGLYSLLSIAQSIGELNITDEISIKVVTNNMHIITGEEALYPEKAIVNGPIRTIPQEYQNLRCTGIDIENSKWNKTKEKQIVECLLQELNVQAADILVAYRHKLRFVQSFEPMRLTKCNEESLYLKEKGVYIITGGFDGVGLEIAEYLVEAVKARLVLISSSLLPPREEWDNYLKLNNEHGKTVNGIKKVKQMEERGAEILTMCADVSDMKQMERAMEEIDRRFSEINGVVHSAVMSDEGLKQLRTREITDSTIAQKTKGTLIINKLMQGRKLDFILYCSSISSIAPLRGQAGYCSANNFLDAFANYAKTKDKTFVISINLDAWQETSTVGKMNFNDLLPINPKDKLTSLECIEVFKRIMESELPDRLSNQVIVSKQDLKEYLNPGDNLDEQDYEQPRNVKTQPQHHQRPDLNTLYIAPESEIEKIFVSVWAQILGIEEIGVNDNFFDLGGDSLKTTHMVAMLRKNNIAIDGAFKYPTISELSKHVHFINDTTKSSDEKLQSIPMISDETVKTLDIKPDHKSWRTCYEDIVVTVLNWLGRGHELMYLESWQFSFMTNTEVSISIGQRLNYDLLTEEEKVLSLIKRFYGVDLKVHLQKDMDETIAAIGRELQLKKPVIIGIDSYWIPWDSAFQIVHWNHAILIVGIDEEKQQVHCTDPFYSIEHCVMSYESIQNGIQNYVTFEIDDNYDTNFDWRESFKNIVLKDKNPENDKNIFKEIRSLANAIENSLDVAKETEGYKDAGTIPLNQSLREIAFGRYKFAKLVEYLAKRYQISELFLLSNKIKLMGVKWDEIREEMFKVLASSTYIPIDEIVVKIQEAANYEESIAHQLFSLGKSE